MRPATNDEGSMTQIAPNLVTSPERMKPVIAPIERLQLLPSLDGSSGSRGSTLFEFRIDAHNDIEAIAIWLSEVTNTDSAFRSYRLEAERCLLWATASRDKPLSALDDTDLREYAQFLLDPQPRDSWVYAGSARREDARWRPFRESLSPQSAARALGIVSSLFDWLETAGYIPENPWHGPALAVLRKDKKSVAPALLLEQRASVATAVEWSYITAAIGELDVEDRCDTAYRTKAVFYLAYFADLKPGEIASLRTSSLSVLAQGPAPVWKLCIEIRPPNLQEIILLPPAQQALERYLEGRGIVPGAFDRDRPLIGSSRSVPDWTEVEADFSAHAALAITKPVFMRASVLAQAAGDEVAARRLSGATTNWLRHALEVHVAHMEMPGGWPWFLLGSCWLAPPASRAYLPPRKVSNVESALRAFDELQPIWTTRSAR